MHASFGHLLGLRHDHCMAFPTDLPAALSAARISVEEHVRGAREIGITWQEETVSELVWVNTRVDGRRPVRVANFTKFEESKVGADWLWWFVEGSGECYGMLVQAKRLKDERGQPALDLRYTRKGAPDQMTTLFQAARDLYVPAVYALYFGPVEGRGLRCGPAHADSCEPCRRKTIAVFPGLRARLMPPDRAVSARHAFAECLALEDLADTTQNQEPARYIGVARLPEELQHWMTQPQVGARQIAKRVYQMIIRPNELMESADVADRILVPPDAVFQAVPLDVGHFGQPYVAHVLRGLRRQPPPYVLGILASETPMLGPELDGIAGVVVLTI
jgi:hypothetical protein